MITLRAALPASLVLAACADPGLGRTENPQGNVQISDLDPKPFSPSPSPGPSASSGRGAERYRNTYYDFPSEDAGTKDATVFDAACKPIAKVTKAFHDKVCLQGSGRLSDGATVSFAKRDCSCAAECPKSAQKICFERLDPAAFPWGRGSTGKAITPLKTVAVDPAKIPMGSSLYVREYAGLPGLDGRAHDGCFVAEDRGSKIEGAHIDVFTGSPTKTKEWNTLVPSNDGVSVEVCSARCPLAPACESR